MCMNGLGSRHSQILGVEQKCRQGHDASAESLAQTEDVGCDVPVIDTEDLAGAAHAGLHLVGDEENTIVVAQLAQARPIIVGWHHRSRFTLHGFCDDGGDVVADRFGSRHCEFDRVGISKGNVSNPVEERKQWLAVGFLSHQRKRAQRLAMKTSEHRNEALSPGVELREFHSTFNRFGTGVGEKAVLDFSGGEQGQHAGQLSSQGIEQLLAVLG